MRRTSTTATGLRAFGVGLMSLGLLICLTPVADADSNPPRDATRIDSHQFHGILPEVAPPTAHTSSSARTTSGLRHREGGLSANQTLRSMQRIGVVALPQAQVQQRTYWCAPASGRALLSALMPTPPGQPWLAGAMGTAASGTKMSAIAPALNRVQARNRYALDHARSTGGLLARLRMDLVRYRAATVLAVDPGRLPWYEGLLPTGGGHAIVLHGFAMTPKVNAVLVWDPASSSLAGRHITSASALVRASDRFQGAMVW